MLHATRHNHRLGADFDRMLHRNNILALSVLFLCQMLFSVSLHAQNANQPEIAVQPLNRVIAMETFQIAEQWMQTNIVPKVPGNVTVSDLSGVYITLRFGTQTVGRGEAYASNPFNPKVTANINALTAEALSLALDDAKHFMLGAANKLGPNDKQNEGGIKFNAIAKRLELDIQYAGKPTKLNLNRVSDIAKLYHIHTHGLIMKIEGASAWLYPGTASSENINLQGQVTRLLAKLKLPLIMQGKIGTPQGPEIYRFDNIQMVRASDQHPITFIHRGGKILPSDIPDDKKLFEFTGRLAAHIMRRQRRDGTFAGTFNPTMDTHKPLTADTYEAATAVFAIASAARLEQLIESDIKQLTNTARAALVPILRDLGIANNAADKPAIVPNATISSVSMTILALLQTPNAADLKFQRDQLAQRMQLMRLPNNLYRTTIRAAGKEADIYSQSLAAAALVQLFDRTREEQYYNQARATLDEIWKQPADSLIPALTWLAHAEFELSRLDRPSGKLIRLTEEIFPAVLRLQVQTAQTGNLPKQDITTIGGFRSLSGLIPEPSWQSALPTRAIARAVRVRDFLEESKRPRYIVASGLGIRFLDQLSIHEENCYYIKTPVNAVGGIRFAMWDNRISLIATSHALIAAVELQHSLNWILANQKPVDDDKDDKPARPKP